MGQRRDEASHDSHSPTDAGSRTLGFPEDTYLVDESRNLLYIPIPKVACTSLKIWFLKTSPDAKIDADSASWKVNAWLGNEGNRYLLETLDPLQNDAVFRFAFVRNPWSRLVSSYLNRIVGRGVEYRQLMKRLSQGARYRIDKRAVYYARKRIRGVGWPERAEVTFRQFVMREVSVTPPSELDPHWRPQTAFLGGHALDFVGHFENLERDLGALCDRLGIPPDLPERNRSQYVERDSSGCFADRTQAELRAMPALPRYRQFYTAELADQVARVYAEDIERFGYDF